MLFYHIDNMAKEDAAKEDTKRPAFVNSDIYDRFANSVDIVYSRERGALKRELEAALVSHQKKLNTRLRNINKLKSKAE